MNRTSKRFSALAGAALPLALAAAIVGCGGGGGGGGTTTGSTGSTGATGSTGEIGVNLGSSTRPGQVELTYLTGQGRSGVRALGDMTARMSQVLFVSSEGTVAPSLPGEVNLSLNKYTNNIIRYNVPFSGQNSREFSTLNLNVDRLTYSFGQIDPNLPNEDVRTWSSVANLPQLVPVELRTFPGRYTALPVFINDGQIDLVTADDGATYTPTFLYDQFRADNAMDDNAGVIQGFLSDYLAIDITGIPDADRPRLSTGEAAERVYLSGDNYALSRAASAFGTKDERGRFQLLSRTISDQAVSQFGPYIDGRYAPPETFDTGGSSGLPPLSIPGTYSLIQDDPSQPPIGDVDEGALAKIVSVQGIWRDYKTMLSNLPGEFAILMPNSRDDEVQDILLVKQSGGVVSAAFYGSVDLTTNEIFLAPLSQIANQTAPSTKVGTLTPDSTSPQAVRRGTYTLDAGTVTGFARTGKFVVYRL